MDRYAMIIALVLFFYGNCTYKIAMLRKTLGLPWGFYLIEAVAVIITAIVIAVFAFK